MPNRIIKESICTSDTVDELSWFEECFFYRLIVNCDDYGRMDARPQILKSRLFPLKERLAIKDVKDALEKLAAAGCVVLYECDGRPYLQLRTWEVHQTVRAKKSRYPEPQESDLQADASKCMQMQANVPVIQSESNPNPNTNPNTNPNPTPQADFDAFWVAYPKKVDKAKARKAWDKLRPDEALLRRMLDAITTQKRSDQWTKDGGQFIPNPTTWLNGRRWEDELPTKRASSNPFLDLLAEEGGV